MTLSRCSPSLPSLIEPSQQRLANGVGIVSLMMSEAPLVCIDFWCRAGSVFQREGESGMAHFLEHMIFKGSQKLAAGEFDRRVEALGGCSNAATGFDDVHYHVLIPAPGAGQALDLLLNLVLRPRLEADAFVKERQVVLEELAQSEDQPEDMAVQKLLELACPGHPYGESILGRRQALLQQEPVEMKMFHNRLYRADRCVLALGGALGDGDLMRQAADGPLADLNMADDNNRTHSLSVASGEHRVEIPRLESARLMMAWGQPPAADLEGVMGADLATTMLAEGRRSRLVHRLREELRIVESIDLDLHTMECGSLALLEAVCEPERLSEVRGAIEVVWREVMRGPIDATEWDRARRLVINGYRFGLEAAGAVTGLIGNSQLWGRCQRLDSPLTMLERWNPQSLQCQALQSLDPSRACILEAVPA